MEDHYGLLDLLSNNAKSIHDLLTMYGAQFFFQLEERSRLLKSQVENALTELISVGMITSDSYTGLRTLLIPDKHYTDRRKAGKVTFNLQQAGRWWLMTSPGKEPGDSAREDHLNSVASMLLKRYGIVFRKLAEKEKVLFRWYDLLKIFRKMEAQGKIRGGRFVEGFGGEQYALPEAVSALRENRRQAPDADDTFISISAADPLNLTGYVTHGKRVPSLYSNRILFKNGTPIAIKDGKEIIFMNEEDEETKWKLKKILIRRDVQPELRPYLVY
jgi:ATP-dependent helicase Lhr and Lhr-like helicase